MKLNTTLLGGGSWGTTVASLVSRNAPALLWARDAKVAAEINEHHTNEKYLPGARLYSRLRATGDFSEAVRNADVLIVGVPAQTFRDTLLAAREHLRPWVPVISLSKGLEIGTQKRMTQIIDEVLPGHPPGVLTGPNLAREIMSGQAAASVLAMEDDAIVRTLKELFSSGLFRVYTNNDLAGCELGGVLKNIIAIACGMGDGLGAGVNTRSAVIARGLSEVSRLGVALGGKESTFAGLAGLGDMIATCTSTQSRNRYVGEQLGLGHSIDDILAGMQNVAEGVKSAPAVIELARQQGIHMPIAEEVYRVLYEDGSAKRAFRGLLRYDTGAESEPG